MSADTSAPLLRISSDIGRPEPVIELRDVFRVHRTEQGDAAALQGTTLTVARGEHLCVLGPSGAGKSTLLRVIAGLEAPSAGVVGVLGRDMGRLSARARAALRRESIGFLGQSSTHTLAPDLPVGEGIVIALALRGTPAPERAARAQTLLDAVSLAHRADARPAELSGGERQRLALCAALAHRPAVLLADEPTGELDDHSAVEVRRLIGELARAHGTTVIVVSHDAATAAGADRCVRLRDGRVGEERRDGLEALVVNRGGWVRLPPELLAQAGIGKRAAVGQRGGELTLRALPQGDPDPEDANARDEAGRSGPKTGPDAAAGPGKPTTVATRAVCKAYGNGAARRQVLASVSVDFAPGCLTAVTGRSGSGKSTLLRLLAGLESPDGGDVVVDGRSLGGLDGEQRARVRRDVLGFLAQEPRLVDYLSAEENVALGLAIRGQETRAARERVTAVLSRLGLADRAGQRVSRLSAGERQRVGLARALSAARGLLVVDEPTSRLDESSAVVVADALAAAAAEGHTVICATHEAAVIGRADHAVEL